ncbi:MAG: hypothetical protein OJI67_07295, partial [Prosthecobacter sp.]|nr:hypothetical protein [Prosthecobacter sp.]
MAVITTSAFFPTEVSSAKRKRTEAPPSEASTSENLPTDEPVDDDFVLCRDCGKPGSLSGLTQGRRVALKCSNCDYGLHKHHTHALISPLIDEELGRHDFCRKICKREWIQYQIQKLQSFIAVNTPPVEPVERLMDDALPAPRSLSTETCSAMSTRLSKKQLAELFQFIYNEEPPADWDKNQTAFGLGNQQFSPSSSSSSPLPPTPTAPSSSAPPTHEVVEEAQYSLEEQKSKLATMTHKQLKALLELHGVETTGGFDEHVLKAALLTMPTSQREKYRKKRSDFLSRFGVCSGASKPFVNQLYAHTFSNVDTFDRRFYEIFKANQVKNWQTTAILSIVTYGLLNISAVSAEFSCHRGSADAWLPKLPAKKFV